MIHLFVSTYTILPIASIMVEKKKYAFIQPSRELA